MKENLIITRKFHVKTKEHGRKQLSPGVAPLTSNLERVPRISRLMALAIHFDELIRTGAVKDQAELARLGRVSRARLTQIMNLLNLAPDIQEAVLTLQLSGTERKCPSERQLRPIMASHSWAQQRKKLKNLLSSPQFS